MRRLAAPVLLAALLVPVVPAGATKERLPRAKCDSPKRVPVAVKKTAKLGDDYITPGTLRVRPNACVTWRWAADTTDSHDVTLRSGPRGEKRWHSYRYASAPFSYSRYLTRKGTYRVYCSLHPDSMRQKIIVR